MSAAKLYYSDAYLKKSRGHITSRKIKPDGVWVTMDSTLFYPGGGGQSPDSGWIADQEVREIKYEAGDYWYEKMQQHTGQHILSAVFSRLFNIDTISVHLGQKETLIELNCTDLSDEQIKRAELAANFHIRQNYAVKDIFIRPDEINLYQLRRDIKHSGDRLRLIQIGDFDCTGCGGIHVKSTVEVGLIKILGKEKIRGHIRIRSVIGAAAYQHYDHIHDTVQLISTKLTSAVTDLPSRIEGLLNEIKSLKHDLKNFSKRWLKEYATRLEPESTIGYFIISDLNPAEIVQLVQEWLAIYKLPCYIIGRSDDKTHFVLGLPAGIHPAADEFLQNVSAELHLRGGGNSELVQGVILHRDLSQDYIHLSLQKLKEHYR
jgi:alanyl-tRNA synthetase